MKTVLLLLLIKIYLVEGYENLYKAYYSEEFVSLVEKMQLKNDKSLIWELFRNSEKNNGSDVCSQHLKNYEDSIHNHENWATAFLDSSGISETGWLSGNTISLGDYKQCFSTFPKNFSSSYCLVNLKISKNQEVNAPWAPHNVPIILSLCVPDTCPAKKIQYLFELSTIQKNATVEVECQDRRSGFSLWDGFALSIYVLIWLLIMSTTIPKNWVPINHEGMFALWDSFNVKKNISILLKINPRMNLLSSIHGVRVISQCFIIWYHILLSEMSINYPVLNKFYFNKFLRSWKGALETELVLAVDTFFVIGGLLLTWNCLEKQKKFNLWEYYSHRYLRLTPPYLATLVIIATFANKLCDGPLCKYLIDKEKQSCGNYWWTNMLYINNIYPGLLKSCMPHSWYLAADWQLFFFLSPFVVLITKKWPHHLWKFISVIFIVSLLSTFIVSKTYHLPTENLLFNSYHEADQYYNKLYATAYTRAGPWAIGMFFGTLLHNYRNNPVKLPKNLRLLAWLFTTVGICMAIELDLPFLRRQQTAERGTWNALFNATQRNVWAVCICWVLFSSGTQKAGPIGNFLCWTIFQPLAKLSYSAYLIHKLIISIYFGETFGSNYFSATTQVPLVLGIIFFTYLISLLLYLSFEAPIVHLEKIIFQRDSSSSVSQLRTGSRNNSMAQENDTEMKNQHKQTDTHSLECIN